MQRSFYVTTVDEKNRDHHYRLSAQDTAPEGHEIVSIRPAGKARVSSILSTESLELLNSFTRTFRR